MVIPKIKFRPMALDENIDLVKWAYFESDGPLSIHSYVIQLFPELDNLGKKLPEDKICMIIEQVVTKRYNDELDKIINDVNNYNAIWDNHNDDYFKSLLKSFNIDWPKEKIIINAKVGIIPVFPRYLDSFSFAISIGVQEDKVKEVAAHESLHFIWFEKWKQLYPETKREEFDSPYLVWQYSEMVTDAILNTQAINKTINVKERSYDSFYELMNDGKNVMEELNKIFLTNTEIDEKIKTGYEYILSVFDQNKQR
ncbi:MAG TPA: hypothetical protein PLT65_03320 [Bacilli bacterium]|nr:hypothetical protein [Bacilli bacterium]